MDIFFFYPMKDPWNGCFQKWTSPVKQASESFERLRTNRDWFMPVPYLKTFE